MSRLRYAWKRVAAIALLGLLLLAAVAGAFLWQVGGTVTPPEWTAAHPSVPFRLSLNTATAEELMALPSMTEDLAASIVRYREDYFPFRSVEELRHLSGVTDTLYEQWHPHLYV